MEKKERLPKVKKVDRMPQQQQQSINLDDKTSEELALLLNQQYQIVMQANNNINNINATLQKRKELVESRKQKENKDNGH